jgi:hypothetical protein
MKLLVAGIPNNCSTGGYIVIYRLGLIAQQRVFLQDYISACVVYDSMFLRIHSYIWNNSNLLLILFLVYSLLV